MTLRRAKQIYDCLQAYKHWFLIIIATAVLFSFFAWLAYPEAFKVLIGLMAVYTLAIIAFALFISIRKQKIIEAAFQVFLSEPNEANEEILCQVSPKTHWRYIREIAKAIRSYQTEINNQVTQLDDYENYIEGWVHEIKKPLSLMTLVLDNRGNEMSPLVRQRMVHVRDQVLGNVERILFYARLEANHKDYMFERLNILTFCKATTEMHQSLLDESAFEVEFIGEDLEVLSDRKGLAFILEQIIANSVQYVSQNRKRPALKFEVVYNEMIDKTVLHISDNGAGVAEEDLPFIFDKGFTGGCSSYTREATGMGLFLVRRMAYDLAIQLDVKSEIDAGLTISLIFPRVKR